jgi:hypothetical protein
MPREYRHIQQYEKEIIELWEQGKTLREIGEKFGFTKEQVQEFKTRYNKKQRKLASGVKIKPKGRPRKDGTELPPSVQQLSKLTQLQYELAIKERRIKRLEMENELMRDFLSLTERK